MNIHPGLIAFLHGFAPQNTILLVRIFIRTRRTVFPSPYESKCVHINKHGGSHPGAQDELMQSLDFKLKTSNTSYVTVLPAR